MNKESLIQKGLALMSADIEKMVSGYEEWKEEVHNLYYMMRQLGIKI